MGRLVGKTLKATAYMCAGAVALDFTLQIISSVRAGSFPAMVTVPPDWTIILAMGLFFFGFGELIEICHKINRQLRRLLPKDIAEQGSLALLDKLRAGFEKEDISPAKREKLYELLTAIQGELKK